MGPSVEGPPPLAAAPSTNAAATRLLDRIMKTESMGPLSEVARSLGLADVSDTPPTALQWHTGPAVTAQPQAAQPRAKLPASSEGSATASHPTNTGLGGAPARKAHTSQHHVPKTEKVLKLKVREKDHLLVAKDNALIKTKKYSENTQTKLQQKMAELQEQLLLAGLEQEQLRQQIAGQQSQIEHLSAKLRAAQVDIEFLTSEGKAAGQAALMQELEGKCRRDELAMRRQRQGLCSSSSSSRSRLGSQTRVRPASSVSCS